MHFQLYIRVKLWAQMPPMLLAIEIDQTSAGEATRLLYLHGCRFNQPTGEHRRWEVPATEQCTGVKHTDNGPGSQTESPPSVHPCEGSKADSVSHHNAS